MSIYGAIRSPRAIYFGAGQRQALPAIVAGLGSRVLLCSDERFNQDPKLSAIRAALEGAGLRTELYDGTIAELPLACIADATAKARAFGPDVIVGIGGGSCLDLAKLVALTLTHGDELANFYGEFKVPGPVLPVVAVPTTAGTGSEVTPVAVLADPVRISKVGISSPYLIPEVAVCDPELTSTCPPGLTAVAGADALTHAIEAFTAIKHPIEPGRATQQVFIGKNTQSDAQARIAIAALAGNLAAAVADGGNAAAREQVMYGALCAGQAFGVAGTAAAHAIQYPVGALTKTAHGLGVAVLMPYVMDYNRSACGPEFAEIARLFGITQGEEAELADAAIEAVAELFATLGIPRTLADLGVPAERLDWVAEQSLLSARLVNNNPRSLDLAAMQQIVHAAHAGHRNRRCDH
jgi:alcohol dehydrogenase